MNPDRLNNWIALGANIGVLLGIFVLIYELRQTQIEMKADSMAVRSQMAMQTSDSFFDNHVSEVMEKISAGQELSNSDRDRAGKWMSTSLRTLENLHYQYQLGVLDEEVWSSNLLTINSICATPIFELLGVGEDALPLSIYRASFVELVLAPCE